MDKQELASPESTLSKPQPPQQAADQDFKAQTIVVIPQFTAEEVSKIRAFINDSEEKSKGKKLVAWLGKQSSNPLVLLIAGFLLTVIVGNILNHWYHTRQQDIAAIRSFSDELNKVRIQKVGEVWERLDQDELAIDELLEESPNQDGKDAKSPDERLADAIKLVQADRVLVSKYRFWLGKDIFEKADAYLDANIRYAMRKLTGSPEEELKRYLETRNAAKLDIEHVRERFLKEVPVLANQ